MRCSRCGHENADDALFCGDCGQRLGGASESAEGKRPEGPKHAEQSAPANIALRLEEETRLIEAEDLDIPDETALLGQLETRRLDVTDVQDDSEDDADATRLMARTEGPAHAAPQDEADSSAEDQLDATVLRPRPESDEDDADEHFVVRRTRDYDHDAQSVNLAGSATNFETLRADTNSRDVRRDPYARSKRKERVPGEGNSRSKTRPILAILLILVVLAGGAAVLTYGLEMWGGKRVPSLTGQSQQNAEIMLSNRGLVAVVESEPADDAIGKVLSQDPEPGARVPEGGSVTIRVASSRVIPEVVGLMEDEARAMLTEAGAVTVNSVEAPSKMLDGTVIAISPEEGRAFTSRQEITLTIAGYYHVPDVVGKKESDAMQTIEEMGLQGHVTYVKSDQTVRTVIETSPAAGERILSSETIEIKVSSPYPSSPSHLAEYFSHSSQDIDAYLQKEGYSFGGGVLDNHGNAVSIYYSSDKGNVTFSSQPYTRYLTPPSKGSSNVLAAGAPVAGVRIDLPWSQVPGSHDQAALEELAKQCGFENLSETCDNTNIKLPYGGSISTGFGCASGKMGDLVWTVLVVDGSRAVATCAREGLYPASELQASGGRVCDYVAYQDIIKSQPPKSSEDEKKDDKSDDNQQGEASGQETSGN